MRSCAPRRNADSGPGRDKWSLSGVSLCDDGSYSDADPPTLDDHTQGLLHDCAKTHCAQARRPLPPARSTQHPAPSTCGPSLPRSLSHPAILIPDDVCRATFFAAALLRAGCGLH